MRFFEEGRKHFFKVTLKTKGVSIFFTIERSEVRSLVWKFFPTVIPAYVTTFSSSSRTKTFHSELKPVMSFANCILVRRIYHTRIIPRILFLTALIFEMFGPGCVLLAMNLFTSTCDLHHCSYIFIFICGFSLLCVSAPPNIRAFCTFIESNR